LANLDFLHGLLLFQTGKAGEVWALWECRKSS
jgi:hypothetical protein